MPEFERKRGTNQEDSVACREHNDVGAGDGEWAEVFQPLFDGVDDVESSERVLVGRRLFLRWSALPRVQQHRRVAPLNAKQGKDDSAAGVEISGRPRKKRREG